MPHQSMRHYPAEALCEGGLHYSESYQVKTYLKQYQEGKYMRRTLSISRRIVAWALVVASLWAAPLWALSLDQAKSQGLAGETTQGYLAPVQGKDAPGLQNLVRDINAKRKAAYMEIAKKNGSPLEVVEQIGGREAIAKAPPGTFVRTESGEWKRK